jgi:hypothetical protein
MALCMRKDQFGRFGAMVSFPWPHALMDTQGANFLIIFAAFLNGKSTTSSIDG